LREAGVKETYHRIKRTAHPADQLWPSLEKKGNLEIEDEWGFPLTRNVLDTKYCKLILVEKTTCHHRRRTSAGHNFRCPLKNLLSVYLAYLSVLKAQSNEIFT
jgi:hypothetical protein